MTPPLAVFHADASVAVGTGHVRRSLVLADALAERGWSCAFDVPDGTGNLVPSLAESRHAIGFSGSACDLLVVDDYGWSEPDETPWRSRARKILVIDDLADRRHVCDVLLDQTAGRRTEEYAGLVPQDCRVLVEAEYALLRPEYARLRPSALARRDGTGTVKRILLTMGGTDPTNATERVLDGIRDAGIVADVDVVLGHGAPHAGRVRAVAETMGPRVSVAVDVSDMAERMTAADFCFGAAGSTAWERCCLGLPTAMIVIAENQTRIAAELDHAGAAVDLGRLETVTPSAIADVLQRFANDSDSLHRMSEQAAAICDGRGRERVLEALAA